ncbi:hypothetical protein ACJX0J_005657 [Zea mays]
MNSIESPLSKAESVPHNCPWSGFNWYGNINYAACDFLGMLFPYHFFSPYYAHLIKWDEVHPGKPFDGDDADLLVSFLAFLNILLAIWAWIAHHLLNGSKLGVYLL